MKKLLSLCIAFIVCISLLPFIFPNSSYADGRLIADDNNHVSGVHRSGIAHSQSIDKSSLPVFDGKIEWNSTDISYNGNTPFAIYTGKPIEPRFVVKGANGKIIDATNYDYAYYENTNAGTAFVRITFKNTYSGTVQAWFKIYLPATKSTSVVNTASGVQISWAPVESAKGYVIYRRAWNLTDSGWTDFKRWNNTTDTVWTDTTVYAGTRYQYGVKAYFKDPMDNYNLGIVGPLKTTVRITSRTLNSVTAGNKQLTLKWSGSSVFTGYQVQIATDSAFTKNTQTAKISNSKTYQTTFKNLNINTTYYSRVRSYHVFEGMTYFGGWSNVINCKVPDPANCHDYVLNSATHKFHYPSCSDVKRMLSDNRIDYYGTREDVISQGYSPCGHCHP